MARARITERAPESDPLMKTAEVARYLGVSVQTLYQWRWLRRGPRAIKIGGLRYRMSDVDAWLAEQETA